MKLKFFRQAKPYPEESHCKTSVGAHRIEYRFSKFFSHLTYVFLLLVSIFLSVNVSLAFAGEDDVAVVYPKVRAPYNKIFLSIIDEIKASTNNNVLMYEVEKGATSEKLKKWIDKKKVVKVVGLGNRGVNIVYQLENKDDLSIVFGVSAINPDRSLDFFAISLVPEPKKLFQELGTVNQAIKTIYVVFEEGKQDELMDIAALSAHDLGFNLVTLGASDVVEMAEMYRSVLRKINPKTEALWMAKTGKSIEKAILNEILRDAWKKKFIVFSSNLTDVKKGALFSLYPNNKKTGEYLIEILNNIHSNPDIEPHVVLSKELNAGLNIRTASHLGIHFDEDKKRRYSLIFPPQLK